MMVSIPSVSLVPPFHHFPFTTTLLLLLAVLTGFSFIYYYYYGWGWFVPGFGLVWSGLVGLVWLFVVAVACTGLACLLAGCLGLRAFGVTVEKERLFLRKVCVPGRERVKQEVFTTTRKYPPPPPPPGFLLILFFVLCLFNYTIKTGSPRSLYYHTILISTLPNSTYLNLFNYYSTATTATITNVGSVFYHFL
ncbi:hypothetical protein B0H65DRAFT_183667 [Neurospora tetraspora]|uniref:Transmembrane protein n=1 Tax=Neurospora tetraspora TaxID=94610 RepID=A0AAE0MSK5_9PEZI|nr:hypothetical protein B0H65DRAFT_183667 [Neurospora tetraspora]